MIEHRKFAGLGAANHGWLNARHHFSFANYYDPERMGWGALRVWNDDEIAANSGFPPHPHDEVNAAVPREDLLQAAAELGIAGSGLDELQFARSRLQIVAHEGGVVPIA